jgi:hypothetical protein
MVAGRLRDPSGETGSLPMRGREGHCKPEALPAPARGRARSTPAAITRAGPAAVFDRAQARRGDRSPARRWVRAPARAPAVQAASAESPDRAVAASDSDTTTPTARGNDHPARTCPTGASWRR